MDWILFWTLAAQVLLGSVALRLALWILLPAFFLRSDNDIYKPDSVTIYNSETD